MTTPKLTRRRVADAYRISRAWVYFVSDKHGFTLDDWLWPDRIFSRLLELSNDSPLRTRLVSPTFREKVRLELASLAPSPYGRRQLSN